jgi:hypothetical protein
MMTFELSAFSFPASLCSIPHSAFRNPKSEILTPVSPHNRNAANVHGGKASQVMGQPEFGVFQLTFAGKPLKLEIHLVKHS